MYLGMGEEVFPAKFKGKFDCCTASGVFLPDHMPAAAMDDMHSCLKTGGYFVTAMRKYLFVEGEPLGYKDKINEMVREEKFKLVTQGEFIRGNKKLEAHELLDKAAYDKAMNVSMCAIE
jgi:hypothetical protein